MRKKSDMVGNGKNNPEKREKEKKRENEVVASHFVTYRARYLKNSIFRNKKKLCAVSGCVRYGKCIHFPRGNSPFHVVIKGCTESHVRVFIKIQTCSNKVS